MLFFVRSIVFSTAIISFLSACGGSSDSSDSADSGRESATLFVRAQLPIEVLLGDFDDEITLSVEVTAADIAKLTKTFSINIPFNSTNVSASSRHVASGTIDVPVGFDRTITLSAYNDGIEWYSGFVVTDILAGENSTVKVTLKSSTNPTANNPKLIEATIGSGAIAIKPWSIFCPINGKRQLSAEIYDELGQSVGGDIFWSSSDDSVASVTDFGEVQINGSGEALITATSGSLHGTVVVKGAEEGLRNISFFMTADPQYRDEKDEFGKNQGTFIKQMNSLPGNLDGHCGLPVPKPLGVIVAGDLTQSAWKLGPLDTSYAQLNKFEEQWGLDGTDGLLKYRVFEGYGNHDDLNGEGNKPVQDLAYNYFCNVPFYHDNRDTDECTSPVINFVRERNQKRKTWVGSKGLKGFWTDGFTEEGPEQLVGGWKGGLHYSWDWGDVHFVNTNLYAGKKFDPADGKTPTYARNGFQFLVNDLKNRVGNSGRPVVIIQHYGFDAFSNGKPLKLGWTCQERQKLATITEKYNVIAFFSGHDHRLLNRSISHDGVINYTSGDARNKDGGFLVVRLIGNQIHIQFYKNGSWRGGDSWNLPMPDFTPSEPIDCSG